MSKLQIPPNKGSSTHGVQEQALPLRRESGQDAAVGQLRELWDFAARHPVGAFAFAAGAALNLYGIVSDGLNLYSAGLAPWAIQAAGAFIFFLAVASMLYRWSAEHSASRPPLRRTAAPAAEPPGLKADPVAEFAATRPMSSPPPQPPPRFDPEAARRGAEAVAAANRQKIIREWSRVETYELYQAANLWAEALPPPSYLWPLTDGGVANLAMLKAAIRRGELEATLDDAPSFMRRGPSEQTCVNREALIAYAEKKGERPVFLFPKG